MTAISEDLDTLQTLTSLTKGVEAVFLRDNPFGFLPLFFP